MAPSRFLLKASAFALLVSSPSVGFSQNYPSKPIRIVTLGVGGGGDLVSRMVAQGITGPLGQPVIVENRSAPQALEMVANAPPDGYTLTIAGPSVWMGAFLQKMPHNANNFAPISLISREINIITVHPSLPVKNVKEFVALARARPGQLNYGSAGLGSAPHLATLLFDSMAGTKTVHIPYKSGGLAGIDLLSGHIEFMIASAPGVMSFVKTGRLRALAVTSEQPSALAPGIPTATSTGLPGFVTTTMTSGFSSPNTPAAIINRLNQEIVRVLAQPDVKAKFLSMGSETVGSSPEQWAAIMKAEIVRMSKLIEDANIKF